MHTIIHPSGEDDTAAFARAIEHEGSVIELINRATYTVGHLVPNHDCTIYGHGGTIYTDPANYHGPRIRRAPGCEAIFDCSNGARGVTMSGFLIDGVDGTAHGISGGSCHLNLDRMYIADCLIGIGGAVHGGSAYTYTVIAARCKIVNCRGYGIDSPVDSEFASCICAANACNVHALPGANHNRFSGRHEWPSKGENFRLDGYGGGAVRDWVIADGTQLDRAATCNVFLRNCCRIQLKMGSSGRPGRLGTTEDIATSAHLYCEDSSDIIISSVQMWAGADDNDDGSGVVTPVYAAEFKGVNRNVNWCGGSVVGGYTGKKAIHYIDGKGPDAMPGVHIWGVGGLANFHH